MAGVQHIDQVTRRRVVSGGVRWSWRTNGGKGKLRKVLYGNEAIALGAYQGGVRVASGYPGTPSSEILENLARYEGVYAEWAPNEKVGLDVAIGAAYAGTRALATMKHVGLNVAADSLFYAVYTGVIGGLVIVTADDPGMHSSQNEQDNRHYARFAKLPLLEPSDSQEAKDFVILGFEISERFQCPVLLRTTTRIAHSKSLVEVEDALLPTRETAMPTFKHVLSDPGRYAMVPANARRRHVVVEERLRRLGEYAETCPVNVVEEGGSLGIITSGISYQYAREAFPTASFLKLGMPYPLPRRMVLDFAAKHNPLLVVEELDPFLEEQVKLLGVEVQGKRYFPLLDEFNADIVRAGAAKAGLAAEPDGRTESAPSVTLPVRPPVLCPGCGHRGIFYILSKLKIAVMGDIGCYSLGVAAPLAAMHTIGCMGASTSVLHGALKAGAPEPAVAVIGDSTFLHSGIPPLLNTVHNASPSVTIILNNRITAMTGHQENPTTGRSLQSEEAPAVDLEAVVRALGVRQVFKVDPYDLKATEHTIECALAAREPAVIIAECACVLRERKQYTPLAIDKDRCRECGLCLRLGCPALVKGEESVIIDETLCTGCGLCSQVCARKAVIAR